MSIVWVDLQVATVDPFGWFGGKLGGKWCWGGGKFKAPLLGKGGGGLVFAGLVYQNHIV